MISRRLAAMAAAAWALASMAATLTPQEALLRASSQSLMPQTLKNRLTSPTRTPRLVYTAETASGAPAAYLFALGDDGFALLGADDAAAAVLGYGDRAVPQGERLPDNISWWIGEYSRQIEYAAAHPSAYVKHVDPELRAPQNYSPISPMVSTTWNQDSPYNNACPTVGGKRAVTGCVATAMAQIMKYHNWPASGTGSVNYTDTYGNSYSMTFGTLEWDKMLNSYADGYTPEQATAVAFLMKSCGYSVNMAYSASESGAQATEVVNALKTYFNYDIGVEIINREYYLLSDWQERLYKNLREVGPVLYTGSNYSGTEGHAFVCDGYSQDGFFHFNWGWGGMFDGYFQLTALQPEGVGIGGGSGLGFNFNQQMILGIRKPVAGSKAPVGNLSQIGNLTGEADGTALYLGIQETQNAGFFNIGTEALSLQLGIMAEDNAGNRRFLFNQQYESVRVNSGARSYGIYLSNLPDGTYKVYPATRIAGQSAGQVMLQPISAIRYVNVTKSGNTLSVTTPSPAAPTITSVDTRTDFYIGHKFDVVVKVRNNTDSEIFAPLALGFVSPDAPTKLVARSQVNALDLASGESTEIRYFSNFYTAQGTTMSAGTYYMIVFNASSGRVYYNEQVTINPNPGNASLVCSKFEVTGGNGNVNAAELQFHAAVKCNSGLATEYLQANIFKMNSANDGVYVKSVLSDNPLNLSAGESADISLSGNLTGAAPGEYAAQLYYGSDTRPLAQVFFTIGTTGVEDVRAEAGMKAEYFDLTGRPVHTPQAGNIYLKRSGSKVEKIVF